MRSSVAKLRRSLLHKRPHSLMVIRRHVRNGLVARGQLQQRLQGAAFTFAQQALGHAQYAAETVRQTSNRFVARFIQHTKNQKILDS